MADPVLFHYQPDGQGSHVPGLPHRNLTEKDIAARMAATGQKREAVLAEIAAYLGADGKPLWRPRGEARDTLTPAEEPRHGARRGG